MSFWRPRKREKIFVGLSGGVDSAVSAALLIQAGHDVTGVFIRTWHPEGFPCSEGEDEREAMRVAAHLGIPFRTLDLKDRYRDFVAQEMIDAYARGETPNPDALCNREVKFGGFVEYAKAEGADGVATGHYARLEKNADGSVCLLRAPDANKDQSYFLALTPPEALSYAQFPIGDLHKAEVRALAEKFNLPNAKRKDSQGICFLGALDLAEFLSAYITLAPGVVIDEEGVSVGTHRGAALYTVGERHGFTAQVSGADTKPLYVLTTDVTNNTVTVGPKESLRGRTVFSLRDVVGTYNTQSVPLTFQVRYHGTCYPVASVTNDAMGLTVKTAEPVTAAAGQIGALYAGEKLVCAGTITPSI